tara:strand:- start:5144 stop:5731 length:588 start_codon:yes stop_codon:yes gene_type:complete
MKATDIVNQIKEVLGMDLSKEVQLAVMKLDNGTEIEAEAFEVDQQVFIKNEDGESIALPVGDYMLEDGQTLKVETEGVIAAIGEAEAEEEVEAKEEPEQAKAPTEEVVAEEKEMSYATKEELEEVKAVLQEIKEEIKSLGESKEEMKKESVEDVEMNAEVVEPIAHNPEALSSHKYTRVKPQNSKMDLIRKIIYK